MVITMCCSTQNYLNISITEPQIINTNQGITQIELFVQLILFYFGFGIAACIGNICIAGGIACNKKQRSRFHVIIAILSLVRSSLSFQFTLVSIYRFLRTFDLISIIQTRINCHFIHFFLYNASTIELCLLCVLVIDRILAIAAYKIYALWTYRQAKIVGLLIVSIVSILKLIPFYLTGHFQENVKCLNVNSPGDPKFNAYNQHTDLVLSLILLFLYAFLMIILHFHLYRLKKRRENFNERSAETHIKKRTKLIPTLRNMVLVHCGFVLSSKIMLFLSGVFKEYGARLVAYGGVLLMIDLLANVIILLTINRDIRRSSLTFLRRETSAGSNTNGSGMSGGRKIIKAESV